MRKLAAVAVLALVVPGVLNAQATARMEIRVEVLEGVAVSGLAQSQAAAQSLAIGRTAEAGQPVVTLPSVDAAAEPASAAGALVVHGRSPWALYQREQESRCNDAAGAEAARHARVIGRGDAGERVRVTPEPVSAEPGRCLVRTYSLVSS